MLGAAAMFWSFMPSRVPHARQSRVAGGGMEIIEEPGMTSCRRRRRERSTLAITVYP